MTSMYEHLGRMADELAKEHEELILHRAENKVLRSLLQEAYGMDFAHGRISDVSHWQVGWMQRVKEALVYCGRSGEPQS